MPQFSSLLNCAVGLDGSKARAAPARQFAACSNWPQACAASRNAGSSRATGGPSLASSGEQRRICLACDRKKAGVTTTDVDPGAGPFMCVSSSRRPCRHRAALMRGTGVALGVDRALVLGAGAFVLGAGAFVLGAAAVVLCCVAGTYAGSRK